MSKELKPTLGTGVPKTRKRNIALKHDPEAFRNKLLEILEETEGDVKRAIQLLDNDGLDYSRYGEVFTEVVLAGNIVEPGGSLRGEPTDYCVFQSDGREEVTNRIDLMHQLMRRKPFLRARYDTVLGKLLLFLPCFSTRDLANFANAVAIMMFRNMITPSVLNKIGIEANVEKGFALDFVIAVMEGYLHENDHDVEKMMHVLKSAGIDTGTMVEWMPSKQRSAEGLSEHFKEKGLDRLVDQNQRRMRQTIVTALKEGVSERIAEQENLDEIWRWVEETSKAQSVGSAERVGAVWDGVVASADLSRKTQQNRQALLQALQQNSKLLFCACKTGHDEFELVTRIQSFISQDMEMLKIAVFRDIVHLLYQTDVLSEDTILRWYRRGTTLNKGSAASSNIIRDQMEQFIKWLETADVESDDDE
mmetsp:Transcript_39858/g.97706  ORF Transcript_39858/g.97706 Transcript_39858/m.97706 type:complete len:419 (+) Transcript_39858:94-1350(+)|eukprot:CAMPEP_0198312928 /NCGR_PEP_ID=MMETSP1450-20131203/4123_1 /TAXON_ID=753684 ORGANISM="Madagascaria erythrocladiodes, Strain CCMP3234" /NCGR_SAMPLE_ID=MMETSP1450 /ASSEMBLY_ACC=CAM_ASM_001115 /LENGTH=418 /DNA_ID=CAMNT_0044015893 /DNA_START=42 /DNA_END=1298 /DNA_ORIENTATION=+